MRSGAQHPLPIQGYCPRGAWTGHSPSHPTPGSWPPHLPPGFNALVHIVREGAAGGEAAGPLGHVQAAILQHDFALADDYQGSPTQLHAFKDVILRSLETGAEHSHRYGRGEGRKATWFSCACDSAFSVARIGQVSQEKPTMHPQGLSG